MNEEIEYVYVKGSGWVPSPTLRKLGFVDWLNGMGDWVCVRCGDTLGKHGGSICMGTNQEGLFRAP